MSPLRPKSFLSFSSQPMHLGRQLSQVICLLTATGSSWLLPAAANAAELDWGVAPFTWGDGTFSNAYPVAGATIQLDFTISGGTFDTDRPQLAGPGTGVPGFSGGLTDPSLLTTYDFAGVGDTAVLTVESTNAAGDRVPLDNLNYTIIDIDRSCNRDWQDVVSTRGLLVGNGLVTNPGEIALVGTPVLPTIDAISNVGGFAGSTGTVENITADNPAGAAYTPAPSSLTFRGVTFGRALGDAGQSVRADPNGRGGGCTTAPDNATGFFGPGADGTGTANGGTGNRGAEAENSFEEGNVDLSFATAVDRIEFQFGNGVVDGTANGLGFALPPDPGAHGVGVLAQFTFNPGIIAVAKSATAATPDPDRPGNFLTTFTVNVENLGEVDLNTVQVTDDLATTFPDGFVVTSAPVVSSPVGATTALVANPNYGVGGDTNLLTSAATNVLDDRAAGGAATITFTVSFNPGTATAFANQAQASGITPGGGITRDLSNDGTDVDEDDNLDPTDPADQTPTPIVVNRIPAIGVTKQVTNVVNNADGTYTVTYRHIVRNLGSEALTTIQLSDQDIQDSFRQGQANGVTSAAFVPNSVTAFATAPAGFPAAGYTPLTATPGFDGDGANLELATVAALPVGGYGIVDYQVIINPEDPLTPGIQNLGDGPLGNSTDDVPYEAQASVTAVGATSTTAVSDLSDDVSSFPGPALPAADQLPRDLSSPANGTANDPVTGGAPQSGPIPANDPNAATNENNRTPITLPAGPQIGVTKQVSNVVNNGDGTYTVTYRQIVSNLGVEAIDGVTLTEQPANTIFRQGQPNGVTSATFVPGSVAVPTAAPATFPPGYVTLSGIPTFDSVGNLQLANIATLPVGGYGIVDYQVIINPTDPLDPAIQNLGDGSATDPANDDVPYESQVTATGTGAASGAPVSDLSDDVSRFPGTPLPPAEQLPRDLSTPANGNATDPDENTPTPLTLAPSPRLGLTKQVTNIVDNGDGSFNVTFEYVVTNVGLVDLDGVRSPTTTMISSMQITLVQWRTTRC